MTPAPLVAGTSIARVRVRTACRDSLQVSLRAGALLDRLDLSPPGLPASSILLIRALRDPLPGCVSLVQPGGAAPASWQQAVSASIAGLAREAARPARGPVPAGADAVLFADEAELVACLVRDWLHGRVAGRWWWRSVLGDLSPQQWLWQRVLARGEVLVPAMAMLAEDRDGVAWPARLPDSECEMAVAAIARSHALSLETATGDSMVRRARGDGADRSGIKREHRARLRSAALERLVATAPEVLMPVLRPPQRRLVALALTLARAPSWARTPELALAIQELERSGPNVRAYAAGIPEVAGAGIAAPLLARAAAITEALQKGDTPAQSAEPAQLVRGPAAAPPESEVYRDFAQRREAVATLPAQDEALAPAPATAGEAPAASEQPLPVEHALRVRTQFGGIFYLLNAALAMQLYSDFTAPRGANLRLSPWDWLALVGRTWFGRQFARDPVWDLLARLSGRTGRRLRRPRWLSAQLERLQARLALALGEERSTDIPALVCRYPAEIALSATGVHVHLSLASLPLALRVAGLDRDPGWIPAAGRSLAFHFQ